MQIPVDYKNTILHCADHQTKQYHSICDIFFVYLFIFSRLYQSIENLGL